MWYQIQNTRILESRTLHWFVYGRVIVLYALPMARWLSPVDSGTCQRGLKVGGFKILEVL